ncbi:hypothetical protein JYJ95_33610 [Corallococcus exiguus]|uniref:hypothetical protein n=1 Tax=Corallococcus exiguus TaxID=83462 RepID=UPI001A8C4EC8|nr:hypothetical protein [Corallococcus exiguus]MBN8471470.1 hypothetical protein [Corallococcus exiguus]
MHTRIAVGLLAGGLMLGCGGLDSEATTSDAISEDARTVQAQAGAMADEFEVKAHGESGLPCNSDQRKAAEEHMVKNHSSFAKMVSCEFVIINYQGYIRYSYTF